MLPFGGCGRKKQVTAQKAGVLKPEAPGKEVLDHGEAVVDISNVAQGYVALRYKGSALLFCVFSLKKLFLVLVLACFCTRFVNFKA